ncbi:hypothetical protein SAMN04488008_11453 [Maribacter orientalis]|uniref:Uncharacterized protein n=1 Tax=Maribacter orientalis TaxID=228957 RepID=A0A1H7X9K4_9FLAO|nr:hypothetical protein [Maribacter orientalis]SEM30572.1 hypothetical protein SAMN04488008_11453 [Maribacter orientalis]
MFGLSKSDKEEILEFPKTYGVILHGMHQDLIDMQTKVDEYKRILNKYIKYSKSLKEKLDSEVFNVRQEYAQMSDGLKSMKKMVSSLEELKIEIDNKYIEIEQKNENIDFKLSDITRLYDRQFRNIISDIESTNNKLEAEVGKTNSLEFQLVQQKKQIRVLMVFSSIIAIMAVVSLVMHFL